MELVRFDLLDDCTEANNNRITQVADHSAFTVRGVPHKLIDFKSCHPYASSSSR
ncbi:hypothetical protein RAZWK3B_14723 [Roseobacter sp. AzwK-3b]|nr:hypothetical protein RAZWK3B_14723 [Roseobacter sp. AzwK-3b]